MGTGANSDRNKALDDSKERAAGRRGRTGQANPEREAIRDNQQPATAKGKTSGAFGKGGKANPGADSESGNSMGTGGGGGGADPSSDIVDLPPSTKTH